MSEPAKPFACAIADCGMSFTNEDHLHVHTKKHDMYLQLGSEQKVAFVADQTPTPTRFIRNCEEVGLFQDLQNVAANPFDEGFKRAMEAKAGILSLETITSASDDVLHTPQMVFPLLDTGDPTLFNAQRNITISRSSSDESGTIKGFETRTISKLNEVTAVRIVNDVTIKNTNSQRDIGAVSYKNNVIHIDVVTKSIDDSKSVMIYKDSIAKEITKDSIIDNITIVDKSDVDNNKLMPEKLPIMSQRSIDLVVDSLDSDLNTTLTRNIEGNNDKTKKVTDARKTSNEQMAKITKLLQKDLIPPKTKTVPRIFPKSVRAEHIFNNKRQKTQDFEVVVKLPDGNQVRMKPVEEPSFKERIRNRLMKKKTKPKASIVKIPTGTLIPVTLVNQAGAPLSKNDLNKVPITKIDKVEDIVNMKMPVVNVNKAKPVVKNGNSKSTLVVNNKQTPIESPETIVKVNDHFIINNVNEEANNSEIKVPECAQEVYLTADDVSKHMNDFNTKLKDGLDKDDDDCVVVGEIRNDQAPGKRQRVELEQRSAASKRYRERLKMAMHKQTEENQRLREANQRLIAEKAVLKLLITEHMKRCPIAGDIGLPSQVSSRSVQLMKCEETYCADKRRKFITKEVKSDNRVEREESELASEGTLRFKKK